MTTATTPEQIERFRMISARGALKLEKIGMRHSRLGSIRKGWALHLGLKANAKHDEVIAELTKRIEA